MAEHLRGFVNFQRRINASPAHATLLAAVRVFASALTISVVGQCLYSIVHRFNMNTFCSEVRCKVLRPVSWVDFWQAKRSNSVAKDTVYCIILSSRDGL